MYTGSGSALLRVNARTSTYGACGLGHVDHHTYRFGAPGPYNRPGVMADLTDVLAAYRPEDGCTTDAFDLHSDHSTTYEFVKAALLERMAADPTYQTTLHETVVHTSDPSHWPESLDPQTPMTEPPGLAAAGLQRSPRESLTVPAAMQSADRTSNPKILALDMHASQGGTADNLGKFVHRDEISWIEQLGHRRATALPRPAPAPPRR